jgi:hypothetical protein
LEKSIWKNSLETVRQSNNPKAADIANESSDYTQNARLRQHEWDGDFKSTMTTECFAG